MSCVPESVTGHVDGALDDAARARVEEHLSSCPSCRAQADAETELRQRLRALPAPEPRPGFEARVRTRLRRRPALVRWGRVLLPLAAALVGVAFWLRGSPALVARELAFDHSRCFAMRPLPAVSVGHEGASIASWLESRGTRVPRVPSRADGLQLQGARYCELLDGSAVAHVYYVGSQHQASLFVLPRGLRMGATLEIDAGGQHVRLLSLPGQTLGVVGADLADVRALSDELLRRSARGFAPRE